MDRRLVIAALAAAAAGPAFAQTTQPSPMPATTSPAPSGGGSMAGAMAMGDAEKQHAQRTMAAGAAALLTSRLAAQKAQDDDVKLFASFETREQEGIADVLKSVQDPSTLSGTVKAPSEQEAMSHLDAKGQEMVKKMQGAKAGDDFDKDYVKGQLDGHRDLLKIQQDYLKSGKNLIHVSIAKLASAHIEDHIRILEDLDQALRG